MTILRTASVGSNFIGSCLKKKECIEIELLITSANADCKIMQSIKVPTRVPLIIKIRAPD